jgi:hypothetical protein
MDGDAFANSWKKRSYRFWKTRIQNTVTLGLRIERYPGKQEMTSELADEAPEIQMLEDKFAEMRETFQDLGKNVRSKVAKVETVTREHPKTALGMAFMIGVGIGGLAIAVFSLSMQRRPQRE